MANSFHVPCPSCEANVLVKSAGLIGKKIDCAKCKYRFTVPDPDAADEPDENEDKKGKKKAKKKGGNPKVLIGVGLGVGAVALLAVAGVMLMGGGGSSSTPAGGTPSANRGAPAGGGGTAPDAGGGGANAGGAVDPDGNPMPMGGAGNDPNPNPKPKPAAGPTKDPTNLLPNKTASVLRVNMGRLQQTPFHAALFDRQMLDFFRKSMLFEATDIADVFVCTVDADRDPFVLIRTKAPVDTDRMIENMDLEPGPNSPINGRAYRVIKSNPFVSSVSLGLSTESLIGEAGMPVTEEDKKRWKAKPLSISFYDPTTVIVAETMILERYLTDLTRDGTPEFLSELAPADAPPAAAPTGEGAAPDAPPMGPGGSAGGPPGVGLGRAPGGPPMGFPGGPPGGPGGEAPKPKLFTNAPTYRTVPPELKELLNRLEADEKNPPAVVYADIIDQRVFNRDLSVYAQIGKGIQTIAKNTKIFGLSVGAFGKEKMTATLAFKYVSAEDAKESVETGIMPLLNALKPILGAALGTSPEIRGGGGAGGAGGPGGSESGAPGSVGFGIGSRGGAPPGTGSEGYPGSGGPGGPGGPAGEGGLSLSHIDVGVSDTLATVDVELLWNADKYAKVVEPAVRGLGEQLRGRMQVLSGEATHHTLSVAAVRLRDDQKGFVAGTKKRDTRSERYGLPYPPDHRASFMVDLLPFLGRGALRSTIQDGKFAWYAKENLPAAQKWVPEFLVPTYPQSAWRASHPLADGKTLGGTNYVALSGLGLDSARYDPADPAVAKKLGLTGYDWGSKPSDVTDGMSNTVYMIQVPPTYTRPWIAGGGSTVMGVDDTLAKPQDDFVHRGASGKRSTFVLMADGSVREVPEGIDPKIFKAMVTRAGGESLDGLDKAAPLVKGKTDTQELKGGGPAVEKKAAPPAESKKEAAAKEELDKLQGVWKVKTAVGLPIPAAALSKLQIRITGSRMVTLIDGKEVSTDELMLDPTTSPKTLDSKAVSNPENKRIGEVEPGVYELTGTTLKWKSAGEGSKERPKDLKVPAKGAKEIYVELERTGD